MLIASIIHQALKSGKKRFFFSIQKMLTNFSIEVNQGLEQPYIMVSLKTTPNPLYFIQQLYRVLEFLFCLLLLGWMSHLGNQRAVHC